MPPPSPLADRAPSSPFCVPAAAELHALREVGAGVGYRGIHIYLRYRAVLRALEGLRPRRALAVGCGFGILDRLFPADLSYLGLDLAAREIAFASGWARRERPSFEYRCARLEELALPEASFDLAILSEVLEHVPEPAAAAMLAEVARVLAPGGTLLVTVPNHLHLRNRARRLAGRPLVWMDATHLREYTLPEAQRLLDGHPFALERFEPAGLYFPREALVARVLAPESDAREAIVRAVPGIASHFVLRAARL